MRFRVERDPLGKKKVPSGVLYGAHTQRAREVFQISGQTLPRDVFRMIAVVKGVAARVNARLGLLEARKASAIVKAAREVALGTHDGEFVVDAFQAGAGTPTHMNVNEVVANRALELLGKRRGDYRVVHPNDDVNCGQSTNDVFPSVLKIVCAQRVKELLTVLGLLERMLARKGRAFRRVVKSARTHLQDAVPITLGEEFHAYATSIGKAKKRLATVLASLYELNLGGTAVGTGVNAHPLFGSRVVAGLRKVTRLPLRVASDKVFATQNMTVFVEVSDALKELAVDASKIANDVRLLGSGPVTGLREIVLPAVEPGSSIMPGKVNPSVAEMVNMVCFQVMGNDETVTLAAQAGQLEVNVMMPVIGKNVLESAALLASALRVFAMRCVNGIKANVETCRWYAEHSAGAATLLDPYIGYERAAEIAKESAQTGKSVRDVVVEKGVMSAKDAARVFRTQTGKKRRG